MLNYTLLFKINFTLTENKIVYFQATLLELSKANKNSMFNIYNLEAAFSLIENWEKHLLGKEGAAIIE